MPIERVRNPKLDAAHVDMVVCLRVKDLPIPEITGARMSVCARCEARIWVAPTSPDGPPRYCYPCAELLVRRAGEEPTILRGPGEPNDITRRAWESLLRAGRKP